MLVHSITPSSAVKRSFALFLNYCSAAAAADAAAAATLLYRN